MKNKLLLVIGAIALVNSPISAHKIVEPGEPRKVAKGTLMAVSGQQWNRLQQKEGKYQEVWSVDGHHLNRIAFYGAVPVDKPLIKERHKKRAPLPKVQANMLLPDIPVLLERTYRAQYSIPNFEIGLQEPAKFIGQKGIRFEYSYTNPDDEVKRSGEGFGALVDGALYLVTYEAPSLYYFEKEKEEFRGVVERLELREQRR